MTRAAVLGDNRVFDALVRAASEGVRCPGNDELALVAGFHGSATSSASLKRLEAAGKIAVERGNCSRVVTIIATGKKTAGVVSAPHWRDRAKASTIVAEVSVEADRSSRRREAAKRLSVAARMSADPAEGLTPRVYREPCVRCGVRGDIGCRHTASRLTGSCFV